MKIFVIFEHEIIQLLKFEKSRNIIKMLVLKKLYITVFNLNRPGQPPFVCRVPPTTSSWYGTGAKRTIYKFRYLLQRTRSLHPKTSTSSLSTALSPPISPFPILLRFKTATLRRIHAGIAALTPQFPVSRLLPAHL